MLHRFELEKFGFSIFECPSDKSILEIADQIGDIFHVDSMPLVQTLTPRSETNEPKNTYSGNFGLNSFPMHTDLAHWYMPPRYLLLKCVVPAEGVATNLIHTKEIFNKESIGNISRAHFRPRRPLDNKSYILKLKQKEIYRWDSLFIKPANNIGKLLKDQIEQRIKSAKKEKIYLQTSGSCMLLDNWKVLHGRDSIPENALARKIERIYINELVCPKKAFKVI